VLHHAPFLLPHDSTERGLGFYPQIGLGAIHRIKS
jgi:hypothetical protein